MCRGAQIPKRLKCTPHLNSDRHPCGTPSSLCRRKLSLYTACFCVACARDSRLGPKLGMYRGFYREGTPDGRGEWTGEEGQTVAGTWRQGLLCGHAKVVTKDAISWEDWLNARSWRTGLTVDLSERPTICLQRRCTAVWDMHFPQY
jgi:hypothetical protein